MYQPVPQEPTNNLRDSPVPNGYNAPYLPVVTEEVPVNYAQPATDLPQNSLDPLFDPYSTNALSKRLSDNTRIGFIRKVLSILTLQFTMTAVGVAISVYNQSESIQFFRQHLELSIIALVGYIVTLYALGCYKSVARKVPTNYVLLFVFTCCMTYMVSSITCFYSPQVILAAAILTAATVWALFTYAMTTSTDFTAFGGALWAIFFLFLTGTLLVIFMSPLFRTHILASCLIIFVCCFYIIFDIQLTVGSRANQLSIDDYIFASMMIYLDVVNLFLEILRLMGRNN